MIRLQLARPDQTVLDAAVYNELFTMHGITMVFLVVMPLSAAFFNYLLPLMIGARDVVFPRLNAFSYWAFLFGGLFIYSSWFLGGAPNGGWFGYAPNSVVDPSRGNDETGSHQEPSEPPSITATPSSEVAIGRWMKGDDTLMGY